jgi:hypothetical protein
MKTYIKLLVLVMTMQFIACKDDNSISAREQSINTITNVAWGNATVNSATDGNLSAEYQHLTIQYTKRSVDGYDGTFIVSNGSHAFPEASGKWKFDDTLTKLILDSGRELDCQLSKEKLTLDFIITPTSGRVKGLSGHFNVELLPL